jgi:hypothetical protein
MISLTATLSFAALAGWTLGLSAHARAVARWEDPGARLAWTLLAGAVICAAGLGALVITLLSRGALWLTAPAGALTVAAALGWHTSDRLSAARPEGGGEQHERRRATSSVRARGALVLWRATRTAAARARVAESAQLPGGEYAPSGDKPSDSPTPPANETAARR